jgi:hypothetical protein
LYLEARLPTSPQLELRLRLHSHVTLRTMFKN